MRSREGIKVAKARPRRDITVIVLSTTLIA